MGSPLPSEPQDMIVLGVMLVFLVLSVVLPWKKRANATSVIALGISIVFLLQMLFSMEVLYDLPFLSGWEHQGRWGLISALGFSPRAIVDDYAYHRFITSTLLHGDGFHLVMNFIGLFLLGTQLEKKVGWQRFLVLYFGSGVIAGAVVLLVSPFGMLGQSMDTVSIGASGCIYGILGAYWFLYPRDKIVFPLILIKKWPISLIVAVYIGLTALYIILGDNSNISHIAHFAGFVGAFPIAALVRPKAVEEGHVTKRPKVDDLRPLARTKEQKRALERAMAADEPDVKEAWLEDMFRKVDCPKCENRGMAYSKGKAECPKCGKVIRP